jgi:peroxiredoxin Q/BCP
MFSRLFSEPLPVGSPAPPFTARDESGGTVSLGALKGKNVVLVFYPGDDTTVCRGQLCEFRDSWGLATAKNTVVYGVNPAGESSHTRFREKYRFPFPLLVDAGRKLSTLYHANGIIVKRTVYLIGPDGKIRYARRGKPSVEDVLAAAA